MLDFFFNPKRVALVGASDTPGRISSILLEGLKNSRFSGKIYPVNPAHKKIGPLKCYPSLNDIKEEIDLAIFAVPASVVPGIIKESEARLKGAVIISGGFGESGEEGRALELELKESVKKGSIRIIGPNCMGIYDTVSGLDTFFIPGERMKRPGPGGLSIISQSGSFAVTVMDELAAEGIGVARIVSYGNKIDVNESDCLEFLADDDATRAVAVYIESVEDGRRFVKAASRCAAKKPVAAVKVGRTEAAAKAAFSHTGAIAGRYEIYRAAFKKAGIIELDGYEDFLYASRVLASEKFSGGNRVMIVTDGGGIGVGIADSCVEAGLDVPALDEETKKRLQGVLPPFCSLANPIDLTGSATDGLFSEAVEKTLSGGEYDMAIVAPLWGPPALTDELPELIARIKKLLKKPIIICTPGGEYTRSKMDLFRRAGLQVFPTPEGAARAASLLVKRKKVL
ncbi:MAG: acetate--CoA ligase family protein [Thermodesulfobacteriota bacterium]|nr:MAG: acetate--CoA ligase family protein [Thermodesulfobacteriota bacterium]